MLWTLELTEYVAALQFLESTGHGAILPNAEKGPADVLRQILVPLLRSAEQARELVQMAKFPPRGKRGFGSPIAPQCFSPMPSLRDYLQEANDALLTMVQIETQEALDKVEDIATVEGIDVLFIGPFDLGTISPSSTPHGLRFQKNHSEFFGTMT